MKIDKPCFQRVKEKPKFKSTRANEQINQRHTQRKGVKTDKDRKCTASTT